MGTQPGLYSICGQGNTPPEGRRRIRSLVKVVIPTKLNESKRDAVKIRFNSESRSIPGKKGLFKKMKDVIWLKTCILEGEG